MSLFFGLLDLLLLLYLLVLIIRLVLDWIQVFARTWRPSGIVLVLANLIYGLTDPPMRFLRRFIPPLRLGQVQLDLGFLVLFLGVQLLRVMVRALAAGFS
ncbi:YggT family protein [Georgenia sp. EYE_87]|uniref:YggT family protein n=1 Tax=Georgenia sp. EYE_87 TaxID=2853448 RepID=UPI002002C125|nr:YggT family protein [Georgenia sp. EYE_87]MCK6212611.1 YggT family protein [Georgenia sp. EYE_87]